MIARIPYPAALLLLLSVAAACNDRGTLTPNGSRLELPDGVARVEFEAGTVQIRSGDTMHTLRVEIAETATQRARGLMYRPFMPEDAGMLFIYPAEHEGGFWMYNTLIPLSIAYADAEGRIFQILEMAPCESVYESMCPTYPASAPFQYGLEANQGFFAERGIGADAVIELERE